MLESAGEVSHKFELLIKYKDLLMSYSSLYRSLLDILTETSVFAKCYTLIGMIPLLTMEEINFLSRTLPPECSFLTRKGLVHLLPSPLRGMFDVNVTENIDLTKRSYCQENEETTNTFEILGDCSGDFFSSPFSRRSKASLPERHRTAHSTVIPFFSELLQTRTTTSLIFDGSRRCRDVMGHDSIYQGRDSNSGQMGITNDMNSVVGSSVTGLNQSTFPIIEGDFDATLESILDRRSKATSEWLFNKAVSSVSSSISGIMTGGNISDGTMVGIICACTASAGLGSIAQQALKVSFRQLSIYGVSHRRMKYALQQAASTALQYGVPAVGAVAITAGGMLILRKAASTTRSMLRADTPLHRMLSYTLMLTRTLKLQPSRTLSSSNFFLTNPTLIIVISAWSLTAFVAWRLKSRVKNFKWLFDIILSKFFTDYETLVRIYQDCKL